MYELNKVGEKTYYIESPAKIGIYLIDEENVCLIDSGNDKDAGRKISKILEENKWNLKYIINTHSNADHIGGNEYLQRKYDCKILCADIEATFTRNPILEPSFLYGGFPNKFIKNKFLLAKTSNAYNIDKEKLPEGLEYFELPGHFFQMIGIKTLDDVYFLADCLSGENILNKYHVSYIYDIKAYLETLEKLKKLEGKMYIPSHAEATTNLENLIEKNIDKVNEIKEAVLSLCKKITFEEILKEIFDIYKLKMDFNQYILVGSTVKSYLSYLIEEDLVEVIFEENRLLWIKK